MLSHSRKPPQVFLQEITEFLQQLVSIPSVESAQAIATCVTKKLAALGFEPHQRSETRNILPLFVTIKRQLQQKQSGCNHTSIRLLWAIVLNGTTTHLLEQLSAIIALLLQVLVPVMQSTASRKP